MMHSPATDPRLADRARDYWQVDGVPTLLASIIYLTVTGVALLFLRLIGHIDLFKSTWFAEWVVKPVVGFLIITFPFWAIAALIWLSLNWEELVQWFKARITYPRTGYVAPPSYWQREPDTESSTGRRSEEESWFCRLLTTLGGFWFWLLVEFTSTSPYWEWRPSHTARVVLLSMLLAIRALRFGLYPEASSFRGQRGSKRIARFGTYIRSVLNSFWIWFWLFELLLPLRSESRSLLAGGLVLGITALAIYELAPRSAPQRLGIGLCAALFYVLLLKGSSSSVTLALFLPGIYGAFVGGLKLFRYLCANPLGSK